MGLGGSVPGSSPAPADAFEQLLAAKEIVIFCGSGGVGKTSVAAAAAAGAASRLGGKVLVLTIDPAKRLASAMGIEEIGNIEYQVAPEHLKEAGIDLRGELWAAMLDKKKSWDDLVRRHAPDDAAIERILGNPMYRNITERFVQSHDYIAMERLYELHTSGVYDLIIVDTPPTRNALDFLQAPKRMADFFGGRLLRWLTMPYRVGGGRGARVLNMASRPFYTVADRILGSQLLEDLAEFFLSFQTMHDGFVDRARSVERLLHDRRTTFVVVTTLEAAPLNEAEIFCEQLYVGGFHLGALVLNKTLPEYLLDPAADAAARMLVGDSAEVAERLVAAQAAALQEGGLDQDAVARVLRTVGESFTNFEVVAKREAELRTELSVAPEALVTVPTFERDIHDLAGLARISNFLFP